MTVDEIEMKDMNQVDAQPSKENVGCLNGRKVRMLPAYGLGVLSVVTGGGAIWAWAGGYTTAAIFGTMATGGLGVGALWGGSQVPKKIIEKSEEKLHRDLKIAKDTIEKLRKTVEDFESQIHCLNNINKEMSENVTSLEKTLQNSNATAEEWKQKCQEANTSLKKFRSEQKKFQEKNGEGSKNIKDLASVTSTLHRQVSNFDEVVAKLDIFSSKHEERVKKIDGENKGFVEELNEFQILITSFKACAENFIQVCLDMKNECTTLQKQNERLAKGNETLKGEVDRLKEIEKRLEDTTEKYEELMPKLAKIEALREQILAKKSSSKKKAKLKKRSTRMEEK